MGLMCITDWLRNLACNDSDSREQNPIVWSGAAIGPAAVFWMASAKCPRRGKKSLIRKAGSTWPPVVFEQCGNPWTIFRWFRLSIEGQDVRRLASGEIRNAAENARRTEFRSAAVGLSRRAAGKLANSGAVGKWRSTDGSGGDGNDPNRRSQHRRRGHPLVTRSVPFLRVQGPLARIKPI